jgi:hypothetical protein
MMLLQLLPRWCGVVWLLPRWCGVRRRGRGGRRRRDRRSWSMQRLGQHHTLAMRAGAGPAAAPAGAEVPPAGAHRRPLRRRLAGRAALPIPAAACRLSLQPGCWAWRRQYQYRINLDAAGQEPQFWRRRRFGGAVQCRCRHSFGAAVQCSAGGGAVAGAGTLLWGCTHEVENASGGVIAYHRVRVGGLRYRIITTTTISHIVHRKLDPAIYRRHWVAEQNLTMTLLLLVRFQLPVCLCFICMFILAPPSTRPSSIEPQCAVVPVA